MPRCLTKIASMESSSKRRRTSSSKKSDADHARVISVKRTDMLPRNGVASVGRRQPIAEPSLEAAAQPLAEAVVGPRKRVGRRAQTETVGNRTKAPRAAGRASGKPKKSAASEVRRMTPAVLPEAAEMATPAVFVEERPGSAVHAPESAATANHESAMMVPEAPAVRLLAAVETEMMVEPSAILEETTIPDAPISHPQKRGLVRTVWRLLSTLLQWAAPRL